MNEPSPCALCGSSRQKIYLPAVYAHAGKNYDLVQCQDCGLVFVRPFPELETIAGFYNEKYFQSDFGCGMYEKNYLETESTRVEEYREMLGMLQHYKKSGELLEVGCAAGSFLYYAQRAGFEVSGVDLSAWAVNMARTQFGLSVKQGRLSDVQLPAEHYDIIFLSDLLEHEPEPLKFLAEVRRLLKNDGVMVIKVPVYVNSFYYRLVRMLPWSWTLGRLDARLLQALKVSSQGPKFPPYHLFEYSPRTLAMLLSRSGFRIVEQRSSLIVPEFLETQNPSWFSRVVWLGFISLRWVVKRLNLHGGHAIVFARKA
jgi:SAM-dependent methyltransferase